MTGGTVDRVPFGYKLHNDVIVPDYAVARSVAVELVLWKLGIWKTLREVDGKNGREFKGTCPFGEAHGKDGSFSINKQSGAFMCFACKRSGSHVLRFVELYIDTNRDDKRFDGTGTRAAAKWLISLVAPIEDAEQGREETSTPALLSDFDKGLWCGFMAVMRPQLEELFVHAENPASIAGVFSDAVHEIARKLKEE
jgi:hypothetical protein